MKNDTFFVTKKGFVTSKYFYVVAMDINGNVIRECNEQERKEHFKKMRVGRKLFKQVKERNENNTK